MLEKNCRVIEERATANIRKGCRRKTKCVSPFCNEKKSEYELLLFLPTNWVRSKEASEKAENVFRFLRFLISNFKNLSGLNKTASTTTIITTTTTTITTTFF